MRRASHAALALVITGLFLLLARLTPQSVGHGTHTALGLPPCPFFFLTGLPCPSCGLTTSFVYLFHGELSRAWTANATGPILFGAACSFAIASGYGILRPFAWGRIVATSWFHRGVVCGIAWLFGAWIVKLALLGMAT